MPGEVSDEHQIRTPAHQRGQERVPQHVRGQVHASIQTDATNDVTNGPLREPSPTATEKQRLLAVHGQALSLGEPLAEDLTRDCLERHLPVRVPSPGVNEFAA